MKVFVTGGTGVVGTRAIPALVAAGHEVTAVARSAEKAELVRELGGAPVEVDLFDADAVKAAVTGHDAVANLATSIPPLSKAAGKHAWDLNERIRREASNNLVDAALSAGSTRFVQESIAFPYVDAGDAWIDEDHPVDHVGPFSGSAEAERAAARFASQGGQGVVLRFAQFYAPEATHTQAFNRLLRLHINPFIGPPDAYMSSIHADDAGSAVAAALRAPSGIFNVGDDEPMTRRDGGRAAAAAFGIKRIVRMPRVAIAVGGGSSKLLTKSLRLSNGRFKEATGWAPAHPSIRGSWPRGR